MSKSVCILHAMFLSRHKGFPKWEWEMIQDLNSKNLYFSPFLFCCYWCDELESEGRLCFLRDVSTQKEKVMIITHSNSLETRDECSSLLQICLLLDLTHFHRNNNSATVHNTG